MLTLAMLLQAPASKDCYSAGGDFQIAQCWRNVADHSNKELNRIWPLAIAAARGFDKQESTDGTWKATAASDLLESQHSWVQYRATQCAIEGDVTAGGTLQLILQAQCRAKVTASRLKFLQDITKKLESQ